MKIGARMLLSICIPSYNRGHRALALVEQILSWQTIDDEWEIEVIISNNGSIKNKEGYDILKRMNDKRLFYYEFSHNMQFWNNFNQVVRKANGDYCLLISDEDTIIENNLPYYLKLIQQNPSVAVFKASESSYIREEVYAERGNNAINEYYVRGNYLSGVIYNRKIINNSIIDEYAQKYKENIAYYYYPHMFIDAYACVNGDFCSSSVQLIQRGEEEVGSGTTEQSDVKGISEYGTYESRLQQMQGFVEQIKDIDASDSVKLRMSMLICNKTLYLASISKQAYVDNGFEWKAALEHCVVRTKECIKDTGIKVIDDNIDILFEYIDALADYIA